MRNLLALIFLFFQFAFLAKGQVTFQKLYNSGTAYSVLQSSDSGFVLSGPSDGTNALLLKLNYFGDTTWALKFDTIHIQSSLKSHDGSIIVVGTSGISSGDVAVIKIGSAGNIIWAKKYDSSNNENGYSIDETLDSGFIIVASVYDSILETNDVSLIKTDSIGNIIWSKLYSTNFNNYVGHLVRQTHDNGFIVMGTYNLGSWNAGIGIFLIKCNDIGDTIWTKKYFTNGVNGLGLEETRDGGFIIGGGTLLKTDSLGNLLWAKQLTIGNGILGFYIHELVNGYVIAGTGYVGTSEFNLTMVDTFGNPVWSNGYGTSGDCWCYSGSIVHDGGYALAGNEIDSSGSRIYLIKTDATGNSGCNEIALPVSSISPSIIVSSYPVAVLSLNMTVSSFMPTIRYGGEVTTLCASVGISSISSASFTLSPNPAITIVELIFEQSKTSSLEIYNLLGEKVDNFHFSRDESEIKINVSGLNPGIYFVKVETENGTSVQKLVKQ
ncbi:MAG: T9SS type A sorting domain-containing protein [Bacteroidota bacterium]